jgi:16S rRNA (guanine527-N7)-methyltransferase
VPPRVGDSAPGLTDPTVSARLERYLDLIQRWGQVHNLTAIRERQAMRIQHLHDSASLLPELDLCAPAGRTGVLLDVGSGAGLPGVVVAICRPGWRVVCVDKVGKKTGFIQQVAAELGLPNLRAVHARVEELANHAGWQDWVPQGADVVTARAFASLSDWVMLTQACLRDAGVWLAMKGQAPVAEIADLRAVVAADALRWPVDLKSIATLPLKVDGLDAQRCLVRMTRLTR